MGLFDIFKKPARPYKDASVNVIYELLFCDNLDFYRSKYNGAIIYPWDILFAENTSASALQKVIVDNTIETRIKILAYNKLRAMGEKTPEKDLLGVIVEVGLDNGLDVLATYLDGNIRYINQAGKMIFLDNANATSEKLINKFFQESNTILQQLGPTPWDKARLPNPGKDMVRISFLVSNGLFFGHGPESDFFSDSLAGPALGAATEGLPDRRSLKKLRKKQRSFHKNRIATACLSH